MPDLVTFILVSVSIGGTIFFPLGILAAVIWRNRKVDREVAEIFEQIGADPQSNPSYTFEKTK